MHKKGKDIYFALAAAIISWVLFELATVVGPARLVWRAVSVFGMANETDTVITVLITCAVVAYLCVVIGTLVAAPTRQPLAPQTPIVMALTFGVLQAVFSAIDLLNALSSPFALLLEMVFLVSSTTGAYLGVLSSWRFLSRRP